MKGRIKGVVAAGVALGLTGMVSIAPASAASAPPLEIAWGVYPSYVRNFNPFSTTSMGAAGEMYEPLFYFDDVAPQVEPLLGEHFGWSRHNTVLTVSLRRNVKWSNGMPLTAKDVVFTFNLLHKYPAIDTNGIWQKLSSVTQSGPATVVFRFKKADVPFEWYVLGKTPIVPQAIWSKVGNPLNFLNPHPVISGPYLLHTFSSQEYTLVPNPRYWGGRPAVPQLVLPSFTSGAAGEPAFAAGRIGWGAWYLANARKLYVNADPKYNHYWFPPADSVLLYPNLTNPLLKSLVVRKAISEAIDRKKLDVLAESGYEPPANPTLLSPGNLRQKGWIDRSLVSSPTYRYNPNDAVKLLRRAGYKKNAAGVFVSPLGKPLQFTILGVSGLEDWDAQLSIISRELTRVGISTKVQLVTGAEQYSDLIDGKFQLAMSQPSVGPTPYTMYKDLFGTVLTQGNWERWHNPTVEKLLSDFSATSNLGKQHSIAAAMERVVSQQMPVIGLTESVWWYEWSNRNYVGWPTATSPYAAGSTYDYPAAAVILSHLRLR